MLFIELRFALDVKRQLLVEIRIVARRRRTSERTVNQSELRTFSPCLPRRTIRTASRVCTA
jgi:hypothetical protein